MSRYITLCFNIHVYYIRAGHHIASHHLEQYYVICRNDKHSGLSRLFRKTKQKLVWRPMIHFIYKLKTVILNVKLYMVYVNGQGHDMTKTYLESRQPEMQSFIVCYV